MEVDWSKSWNLVPKENTCLINGVPLIPTDYTIISKDDNIILNPDGTIKVPQGTYNVLYACRPLYSKHSSEGAVIFNVKYTGLSNLIDVPVDNIATSYYNGSTCYVNSIYWIGGQGKTVTFGPNGGTIKFVIADCYDYAIDTFYGHLSISLAN